MAANSLWIFTILPDDIFNMILSEWLDNGKDIVAFDTALCLNDFRKKQLIDCYQHVKAQFKISSMSGFKGLDHWQQSRNITIRNLHIQVKGTEKRNIQMPRIIHSEILRNVTDFCIEFIDNRSNEIFDLCLLLFLLKKLSKLTIKNEFGSTVEVYYRFSSFLSNNFIHPLQELHMMNVKFPPGSTRELLDLITQSCVTLRVLQFKCCPNISHKLVSHTIQHLPCLVDVEYINMQDDEDDGQEYDSAYDAAVRNNIDELASETMQHSSQIQRLHLEAMMMSYAMLIRFLSYCSTTQLTNLTLPFCNFFINSLSPFRSSVIHQDHDAFFLNRIAPTWQQLYSLACNNGTSPHSLLASICTRTATSLRSVILQGEDAYNDESLSIIVQTVQALEELHIDWRQNITDRGISELCGSNKFQLQKLTLLYCEQITTSSFHLLLDTFHTSLKSIVFRNGQVDMTVLQRLLFVDTTVNDDDADKWQNLEYLQIWLDDSFETLIVTSPQPRRWRTFPSLRSLQLGHCTMIMSDFQHLLQQCPCLSSFTGYRMLFREDESTTTTTIELGNNRREPIRKFVEVEGIDQIRAFAVQGMQYYKSL